MIFFSLTDSVLGDDDYLSDCLKNSLFDQTGKPYITRQFAATQKETFEKLLFNGQKFKRANPECQKNIPLRLVLLLFSLLFLLSLVHIFRSLSF